MDFFRRMPLVGLLGITLLMMVVMVYFGVRFKGYRPANHVEWIEEGGGVRFGRSSMAFTKGFVAGDKGGSLGKGVSIEIVLRCETLGDSNFQYILSVYDGSDERQLLIGQWKRWLIVMNGDDYDGKKGIAKVYVDLGNDEARAVWLSIDSDEQGTRVYLDGKLVKINPKLRLYYPLQGKDAWLVVGNSVYGKHAWQGVIMGMALYGDALGDGVVRSRAAGWRNANRGFELDEALSPIVFYQFKLSDNGGVKNLAGDRYDLQVPTVLKTLRKAFLRTHFYSGWGWWYRAQDAVLNLIGFVPLGFMLCAVVGRGEGAWRRYGWLAAVVLAFLFSLSLEVVQAWIPTRSSSLWDLVLNTVGAGVGAWGVCWVD